MANIIYANARAKALENYLLGYDRLCRMVDCNTVDEAIKVLQETNFGDGVALDSSSDFEKLLSVERNKLFSFIKQTCPDENLKNYILLPYDFHNAEAYLKAKYLKTDGDKMATNSGIFDREMLKDKIMADDYKSFPKELNDALISADLEFVSQKATGISISLIFKKALYKKLFIESRKNKDLKEIFEAKVDSINIGIALRVRNYLEAKEFFIEGGTISNMELKSLCEDNFDALKDKCKFFKHKDFAFSAIEDCSKNRSLSDFERQSDGFNVSYLKKDRYKLDGIVPFMLYCFYKLAEIENVRIIFVGLLNDFDKNQIKRRLRDTYEG